MLNWIRTHSRRLFFRLLYLRTPPWDSGITPPELMEFIKTHPPGRALDLGCGTGTNVLTLAEHGWEAAGIDFTSSAIRQARRKARAAGLKAEFQVGDVSQEQHYAGQYNLILDIGCYHALTESQRAKYRKLVAGHLTPGGMYLLYAHLGDGDYLLSEGDIQAFQQALTLTRREDGTDRVDRRSAWFWFQREEVG